MSEKVKKKTISYEDLKKIFKAIANRLDTIDKKLDAYPDLSQAEKGALVGFKDGELEVIAGADEEVLTDNKEESDKAE